MGASTRDSAATSSCTSASNFVPCTRSSSATPSSIRWSPGYASRWMAMAKGTSGQPVERPTKCCVGNTLSFAIEFDQTELPEILEGAGRRM